MGAGVVFEASSPSDWWVIKRGTDSSSISSSSSSSLSSVNPLSSVQLAIGSADTDLAGSLGVGDVVLERACRCSGVGV